MRTNRTRLWRWVLPLILAASPALHVALAAGGGAGAGDIPPSLTLSLPQTYGGPTLISCGYGTPIAGGKCRGYLTAGATVFQVPLDWNAAANTIELLGPGGAAAAGGTTTGGGGGAGGSYGYSTNISLTPGTNATVAVTAGGSASPTTFNAGAISCPSGGNAAAGTGGTSGGSCTGASLTGTHAGGAGGAGRSGKGAGGGGGAGGPAGVGGAGGSPGALGTGGGGGGGADGGSAGQSNTSFTGGTGGGTGGGAGGVGEANGANGTVSATIAGGGGGAGIVNDVTATHGGAGAAGQEWDSTHGAGAGGGGGGASLNATGTGGTGGQYGGGAGGGGNGTFHGPAGTPGNGLIVITYTPVRGIRSYDGTGTAFIDFEVVSPGNININIKPAGTGTVLFPGGMAGWTPTFGVAANSNLTPAAAGTGNAIGDALTLNDGCATHAVLAVVAVTSGGVTAYNVTNPGVCAAVPANPVTVSSTTGSGSGAAFTLTWSPAAVGGQYGGLTLGNNGNLFLTTESPNAGFAGAENTFVGDKAGGGFTGASNYNTAVGHNSCGIGGGTPFVGHNNVCNGTDAARNVKALTNSTITGSNALLTQTAANGDQFTAYGYGSMMYLNSTIAPNSSNAFGIGSCAGANGTANFRGMSCFGSGTGGALSTALNSLIIGNGNGNTVFASGSGVMLIGSGNVVVDTPAAGTSNYVNLENIVTVTGTNTPGTSIAAVAGAFQIGTLTNFTLAGGEFGLNKISASGTAPGAGGLKLAAVAGTNAGSCKIIAYAGTSTTPVTVVDNVGSGC